MKRKIEINTMIARNVYTSESFDFVKKAVEIFCKDTIPEKASEIHRQNKPNHYTDEFRLYGTKEKGIKYHSYYKIAETKQAQSNIYTHTNETFGYADFWIKFTLSSHNGLVLEIDVEDKQKAEGILELFEKEFGYSREQTKEEVFDEIIHELRTRGSERDGKYGIEMGLTAIQIYPDDFWAQFYLGLSYALSNQHKKALEHLVAATKIDPKSYDGFYNLAKSYLELGQLEQAKKAILQAKSLTDNNHVIIYYLALILDKMDDKEEAIKYYKKALKTSPEKKSSDKRTSKSYQNEAQKRLKELE